MTAGRKIALNVVVTYGRSLYVLLIGIFCGRWALMSLGQTDYGLMGLIAGMTAFVSFVNGLLSSAVGRFYSVSVGATKIAGHKDKGLEICCSWFNTALTIHTLMPLVLVIVGYPIGNWAVYNFLTIPADRIADCVWVWRITCASCFLTMVNVPFASMYTAKQDIAEVTLYSFAYSTLNIFMLHYMVTHPGVWLVRYVLWTSSLTFVTQLIMMVRAFYKYPEVRIRPHYLWDLSRMRQIALYAGSRFWTAFSDIFSNQGNAILVNKYLGPNFNASMSVANNVSGQSMTLSNSISGAFWPAIGNKAGEGKADEVRNLAFLTCRLGTLMIIVFAVPLALEIDEVLRLWLKTPPDSVSSICIAILISIVIERMTEGYWMAVMAFGRQIVRYSWTIGWAGFIGFGLTWLFFGCGLGMRGLCMALIVARFCVLLIRLYLGWSIAKLSPRTWLRMVCLPVIFVTTTCALVAVLPRFVMNPCFVRVCITSLVSLIVFFVTAWSLALSITEKMLIKKKFDRILHVKR